MALSHGRRSASVSGTPCAIFRTLAGGCSSSPSRNGTSSAAASCEPTSVLPTPATPITQTSRFFFVTTELESKRGEQPGGEVPFPLRREALEERGGENRHWYAALDRGL